MDGGGVFSILYYPLVSSIIGIVILDLLVSFPRIAIL